MGKPVAAGNTAPQDLPPDDNPPPVIYNGRMFRFLTRRKMPGGLVFGPAAWMPERIETTFDTASAALPETDAKPAVPAASTVASGPGMAGGGGQATPQTPAELLALLERLPAGRTSPIIPALLDQLKAAQGSPKELVLDLLPSMPESALRRALPPRP
jgi:hypothetical protein